MATVLDYLTCNEPTGRGHNAFGERVIYFEGRDHPAIVYSNNGARLVAIEGAQSVQRDYTPAVFVKELLASAWRRAGKAQKAA